MPNIANILGNLLTDSGVDISTLPSGSGTTNYLPKWTGSTALGNSLVFDNGTNVGIGTASPTYKLHVQGQLLSTEGLSGGTDSYTGGYGLAMRAASGNQLQIWTSFGGSQGPRTVYTSGGITNRTQLFIWANDLGTEYARFTSNGRLLIGTTTESTYELDVVGDIRSTLDANINGLTVGKGSGNVASNTIVGANAGASITTAANNTLIGFLAGRNITDQGSNTFVGWYSGQTLNSGYYNTAVGVWSLTSATSGHSNVALGMQAGEGVTTGSGNVFVGMNSGDNVTQGIGNTIVGYQTGRGITTGNYNTIIGRGVSGLSASLSNTIILADGQGNQRLYIDNTGNVGIGTTSPLAVSNYTGQTLSGTTGSYITFYQTTTRVGTLEINGTNNFKLKTSSTVPITFETNSTERARIDGSTGNVLIGTTTDAGYKLDVNGTARVQGNAVFQTANNTSSIQDLVTATTYSAIYLKQTTPSVSNYTLATDNTATLLNYQTAGQLEFREANIFKWGIKTGTLTNKVNQNDVTVPLWINTNSATNYGMIISASASQTQSLLQFRNSSSTILSTFFADGSLAIGTGTNSGYKLDVNGSFRNKATEIRPFAGNNTAFVIKDDTGGSNLFMIQTLGAYAYHDSSFGYDYRIGGAPVLSIRTSEFSVNSDRFALPRKSAPNFSGATIDGWMYYDTTLNQIRVRMVHATGAIMANLLYNEGAIVMNENGNDYDVRIEGDTNQNLFFTKASTDNIGIGTATPSTSAMLEISSTSKGLLLPRMSGSQAEAITAPADGLVVYVNNGDGVTITSTGFWGRDAGVWVKLN